MKALTKLFLTLILAVVAGNVLARPLPDSLLRKTSDSIFHLSAKTLSTNIDAQTPPFFVDEMYEEGLLTSPTIDSVQQYIDKARAVLAKVRETQNFISNLNDATSFDLPVGISKTIGGLSYDIAIYAIRLKPTHAEVDVFMEFEVPQNGKVLTFMARGIKFTKAGGIVGDAKLQLVSDYAINFSGDKSQLILKGSLADEGGTFVRMDCDGFKEMGLDAEVRFSRDLVVPENAAGTVIGGNVTSTFEAVLTNWNDLIVQVSLPPFQIPSVPGMGFAVRDAVFDFSDLRNATAVKFPENYNTDFEEPQLANLWRGIYLREVSIQLPPEFKSKGSNERKGFFGYDLLIDNQGFSGTVIGRNLLPLNDGDMNGWAFSVDSIGVSLLRSQLTQGGFRGNIVVPVSDEQTPFEYNALVSAGGNYLFSVSPVDDMKFNIWAGSQVDIYEASYLEVRVQDKKFLPKAVLHGQMVIQAKLSEGGQGVELADIKFESLQIQAVKPYIQVGAFSFGSEAIQQKMAGFPISIQNIGMKNISDTEMGLDFNLLLNLTGESGGAFAADAGLTVIGALNSDGGRQKWRFKEVEVRSIKVDIDGGAFKFNGSLVFYRNDLVYGDGFNGIVKAEFVPKLKVQASAIFGSVNGERYWYADALAEFTPAIPLFPGVAMTGFGGGAYNRMRMDNTGVGSQLGATASGVIYVPDTQAGLGIKAIVKLASDPSPDAFTADVTFEVAFFRGGGIRNISLNGNAFIATPGLDKGLDKIKANVAKMTAQVKAAQSQLNAATGGLLNTVVDSESSIDQVFGPIGAASGDKGQISARLFVSYDFENRVLHGNFTADINVGNGIIEGGGEAVLHFAPDVWYIYVGTPEQRFGISMGIGPIRTNASSYFMVGSQIPGSPPPPDNVTSILGGGNYNYMKDLNTISQGGGFAFGSSFSVSTGDLQFLIFYANFSAGAGFDIMLKNYGATYCEGSNKRIGINGWYANGQAYAYLQGAVGIRVKVFGKRRSFEIFNGGAAALLQAKLPNPFWMKGAVAGSFRVMGGIVKGSFKCEITIGNECTMVDANLPTSALDNLLVISELTPGAGEKDISVFNSPQAVFNMPVDEEFRLTEDAGEKIYRIKLDEFKLTDAKGDIGGDLRWNETHDVVAFNSFDILPSNKEIKFVVQVSFEEFLNGAWIKVLENNKPVIEKQEIAFTTGPAPDHIPLDRVSYSYPSISQLNFYKDESNEGYIKLKQGMPELFNPGQEWQQVGRFTDVNGTKQEFNFVYSSGTISFSIPNSKIKLNQIYSFELVNVPKTAAGSVDRNVSEVATKVASENQTLDTEVKTKVAEGVIEELQEKSIFTTYFRSSMYPTVAAKIKGFAVAGTWIWAIYPSAHYVGVSLNNSEVFDSKEFISSAYEQDKSIRLEADLTNSWYTNSIAPLIYSGYPLNSKMNLRLRTEQPMGIPPVRAIYMKQSPSDLMLTEQVLQTKNYEYPVNNVWFIYNLPVEIYKDYLDLRASGANLSVSENSDQITQLLLTPFPVVTEGEYKIKLKHILPGINKITSESVLTINYLLRR